MTISPEPQQNTETDCESFSIEKALLHQDLVLQISQELNEPDKDFLNEVLPQTAELLAKGLRAEYVAIFFRRKVPNDLFRWALAINQDEIHSNRQNDSRFEKDEKYPWEATTFLNFHNHDKEVICDGPEQIAQYPVRIKKIAKTLSEFLPSKELKHLVIVPIRFFSKQLGAIRVINRLDDRGKLSESPFSTQQDLNFVNTVGAMLAPHYSNYRKSEKLRALHLHGEASGKAEDEPAAVLACLNTLASHETGFPLAMWREYSEDGSSRVTRQHCPDRIRFFEDADAEDGSEHHRHRVDKELPLEADQGLALGHGPKVVETTKEQGFHYYQWASEHELRAVYTQPVPASGRKCAVVVFSRGLDEFDELSRYWIKEHISRLESALNRFESDRIVKATRIVGNAPAIKRAIELALQAATAGSNVLLHGETGTGKERFAKLIHNHSKRSGGPFEVFDCGANSPFVESEMFGHEVGAFPGATSQRIGRFELANKGVLFLDNIGAMQPEQQGKLLRFLQERVLRRVGGKDDIKVDVQIVAATSEDLNAEAHQGRFSKDLYFRLNVMPIKLPPLKERKSDIVDLAAHFLAKWNAWFDKRIVGIDPAAMAILESYDWPGNVRELENTIEFAVITAKENTISIDELAPDIANSRPKHVPVDGTGEGDRSSGDRLAQKGAINQARQETNSGEASDSSSGDGAKSGNPNKKKAINARMLEKMLKDTSEGSGECFGWTSQEWATFLKCTAPSVVATPTWKELEPRREALKAAKAKDRRGRGIGRRKGDYGQ